VHGRFSLLRPAINSFTHASAKSLKSWYIAPMLRLLLDPKCAN
jgi:hypothetical protein